MRRRDAKDLPEPIDPQIPRMVRFGKDSDDWELVKVFESEEEEEDWG